MSVRWPLESERERDGERERWRESERDGERESSVSAAAASGALVHSREEHWPKRRSS